MLGYIYEKHESQVQSYSKAFPAVFTSAKNAHLYDEYGEQYIDFFAGAGSLNYGHNNPSLKEKLIEYIEDDGITLSLDMATEARYNFGVTIEEKILNSRGLAGYRGQYVNPSGANAVEAALKLARLHTGRQQITAFENAYHGLSLGALAATYNPWFRDAAGVELPNVNFLKYNDDKAFRQIANDKPAAVIVECIQGEGGVNVARDEWLQGLRKVTEENDILMIIDDIQAGCGRSGEFFSFEQSGIKPDIITLSKSISGYGLPFALILSKPEIDATWKPAQHTGTFRGNNHAFVTGAAALKEYWSDDKFTQEVLRKGEYVRERLGAIALEHAGMGLVVKGRGMFNGLEFADHEVTAKVAKDCFEHKLVIERAGPQDEVLKVMPPLTIEDEVLAAGMDIIEESVRAVGKAA